MVRPYPYGASPSGSVPRRVAEQLAAQRDEARAQARHLADELERSRGREQQLAQERRQLQQELAAARADAQQLAGEVQAQRARADAAEVIPLRRAEPSTDEERFQRLSADLANLRRRQQEAIDTRVRQQRATVLEELFSLRDTLERSLAQSTDADSPWHQGAVALRSQLDQSLRRLGVERIGEPGEPFDPRRHDAIGMATGAPDTVVRVERHGFADPSGAVLRPALVLVGQQASSDGGA